MGKLSLKYILLPAIIALALFGLFFAVNTPAKAQETSSGSTECPELSPILNLNVNWPRIGVGVDEDGETRMMSLNELTGDDLNLQNLINYLYAMFIWLAGLIALISIMFAGFSFVFSGANPGIRAKAKEKMKNTLIGLGIIFTVVLFVNVINPDILTMQITGMADVRGECPEVSMLSGEGSGEDEDEEEPTTAQMEIAQCNEDYDTNEEIEACLEDAAYETAVKIIPTACSTILDDSQFRDECVARCMSNTEMMNFPEYIRSPACEKAADEAYEIETSPSEPPSDSSDFTDAQLDSLDSGCTYMSGGTFVRDDVQCYFLDESSFTGVLAPGGFNDECINAGGTCQECEDLSPTYNDDGRPAAYCRK
ncbi:MAG: pilin [Candidatus Spechtbacterales bacterium]